jgi:hypothetical protein
MNSAVLTVASISTVLWFVPIVYSCLVGRARLATGNSDLPRRFRVSRLLLFPISGNFLFGGWLILLGMLRTNLDVGGRLFFSGLGAIFWFIALGVSWQMRTAYVMVGPDIVEFRSAESQNE